MAESILGWLSEYIAAETALIGEDVAGQRITALRQMFHEHRSMSLAQFQETMTTAHFTQYFTDALSRMFYEDYKYKVGSWSQYTFSDTVPDFRDVTRLRMSEPGTLLRRHEKGEATATYIAESKIAYGVDEFARQFDVSWQAILNDDLGKIKETPLRMANAAARFEDSFVSALYDNAVTQATLAALGAPWAGTGRLTAANLAIGVNAMMQRTDAAGNRIQITRMHLVVPPVLLITARQILESIQVAGGNNNDKNVLRDFVMALHVDPYIDFSGADIPWYLFAEPSEIPAVTVARLQGISGPWTYKQRSDIEMISGNAPAGFLLGSYATGDIQYTVEDVIGGWDDAAYVGVTDFRGIYYSSGTTA